MCFDLYCMTVAWNRNKNKVFIKHDTNVVTWTIPNLWNHANAQRTIAFPQYRCFFFYLLKFCQIILFLNPNYPKLTSPLRMPQQSIVPQYCRLTMSIVQPHISLLYCVADRRGHVSDHGQLVCRFQNAVAAQKSAHCVQGRALPLQIQFETLLSGTVRSVLRRLRPRRRSTCMVWCGDGSCGECPFWNRRTDGGRFDRMSQRFFSGFAFMVLSFVCLLDCFWILLKWNERVHFDQDV